MATPTTQRSVRSRWQAFLDDVPDFHARLSVIAAMTGFVVAVIGIAVNALNEGGLIQILLCFLMAAMSVGMIWFARKTGNYEQARVITVVIVFLVIFPTMFFTGGGYQSGMPALMVFGMGFTGLSLMGRGMWVLLGLELVIYSACCVAGYLYPQLVTPLAGPTELVIDVILCVALAGMALSAMLHLLLRVHERNASLLVAKNAELEQIDGERSEFLAMVAHELNTPLAVMRVHLDEAGSRATNAPAPMQHTIGVMTAENERLTRLVGQLRDVSRIASDQMQLDLQNEDLSAIIGEVLRTYQPLVARNGNTLELVRGGAHPLVLVDAERVAQVLVNLLSNASRHTTDGTITVAVRERGRFAEVTVTDTGVGIPAEVREHLFERIGRRSPTGIKSSRDAGLGLGLIISRHIMTAHYGGIEIESTPGVGTTARLTFLLAKRP
ncbi:MAG TPA: HAMP domain-containing sensor histidine kinase [Propionicimonas sp.]